MENKGQWNDRVLLATGSPGLRMWATKTGMVVDVYRMYGRQYNSLQQFKQERDGLRAGHVVSLDYVGGNPNPTVVGSDPSRIKIDFLGFGDRKNAKGVKAYAEATVKNVYPGIDARYYRTAQGPRYDLIVNPGADPNVIQMRVTGANGVSVLADGSLGIATTQGMLRHADLKVFQNVNGAKRTVPAAFTVKGNTVSFRIHGPYDRTKALVIDPLVYGSHMGGDAGFDGNVGADEVLSTASDGNGNVFMTGATTSIDLPITSGPYGASWLAERDGFVVALQGDAYDVTYVAYIGGHGDESCDQIQIDQYGNVWVAGDTTTAGFLDRPKQTISAGIDPITGLPSVITGGDFGLTYRGLVTDPLPFNATAQQIEDALNALPAFSLPPGGFDVTGGPLPDNSVTISSDNPRFPVGLLQRTRPYVVTGDDPSPQQRVEMDPAPIGGSDVLGFTPNVGSFALRLQDDNNITADLPFDVDGATLIGELAALDLLANNPPRVLPGASTGPLPDTPIDVTFWTGGVAPTPEDRPLMTVVPPTDDRPLFGGFLTFTGETRGFITKFSFSPTEVLDPFTDHIVREIPGCTDLTSLAVRPIASAAGAVELAVGGSCTSIDTIPGNAPPGSGLEPAIAFYQVWRWTGPGAFEPSSGRSAYIGGLANASVADLKMDADGSVYATGNVWLPDPADIIPPQDNLNATLNINSNVFAATSGVFANGNLLRAQDIYVRKYARSGAYIYSAVVGGSGNDFAGGIAVDQVGNAFITGDSGSFNYPRTVGAFDQTIGGEPVVTKISADAARLLFSTGLRHPNASANKIAVDSRGNAYIVGITVKPLVGEGVSLTPVAPFLDGQEAALDTQNAGTLDLDGFLTVLNSTAIGLIYSSYIGEAASQEFCNDVTVDRTGGCWVSGTTNQYALGPIGLNASYLSPLAFKRFADSADGWVFKMRFILPILDTITVTPTQVAGGLGSTSNVQVTLRQPAPAGGTPITLRIMDPTYARFNTETGPSILRLTIPEGTTTLTTPALVATRVVLEPTSTEIRAELDGDFIQTRLNIRPWMESFILSTSEGTGGENINGIVTVFQNAPAGGITASLTTNRPDLITLPAGGTVTIGAGTNINTFSIGLNPVTTPTELTITATVAGVSVTQDLRILPPDVNLMIINPTRVSGGEPSTGTVRLTGPTAAPTVVNLTQIGSPVTIPATVTVPTGATEANFPIATSFVPANTSVRIRGSLGAANVEDTLFLDHTQIASLVLSSNDVFGGAVISGTVNLTRPAGPTGLTVPIVSSNLTAATVSPTTVVFAPGATSASFTVNTNLVPTTRTTTISTNKDTYAVASQVLTVRAVSATLTMNPTTVVGGLQNSTGTIRLANNEVAPTGGLVINLQSSQPTFLAVPATVTIPGGQNSATFTATSAATAIDRAITISAILSPGNVSSVVVTVQSPRFAALTLTPVAVTGGQPSVGTIRINTPAPVGGLVVNLSSDKAEATVPATVTIPAGQTSANFTITTVAVPNKVNARIRATSGSATLSQILEIYPPGITSFTFNPSSVPGGTPSRATIRINAPAPPGGLRIALFSFDTNFAVPPAVVRVPAGGTSVSFNVNTFVATRPIAVRISATVADRGPVNAFLTVTGTP